MTASSRIETDDREGYLRYHLVDPAQTGLDEKNDENGVPAVPLWINAVRPNMNPPHMNVDVLAVTSTCQRKESAKKVEDGDTNPEINTDALSSLPSSDNDAISLRSAGARALIDFELAANTLLFTTLSAFRKNNDLHKITEPVTGGSVFLLRPVSFYVPDVLRLVEERFAGIPLESSSAAAAVSVKDMNMAIRGLRLLTTAFHPIYDDACVVILAHLLYYRCADGMYLLEKSLAATVLVFTSCLYDESATAVHGGDDDLRRKKYFAAESIVDMDIDDCDHLGILNLWINVLGMFQELSQPKDANDEWFSKIAGKSFSSELIRFCFLRVVLKYLPQVWAHRGIHISLLPESAIEAVLSLMERSTKAALHARGIVAEDNLSSLPLSRVQAAPAASEQIMSETTASVPVGGISTAALGAADSISTSGSTKGVVDNSNNNSEPTENGSADEEPQSQLVVKKKTKKIGLKKSSSSAHDSRDDKEKKVSEEELNARYESVRSCLPVVADSESVCEVDSPSSIMASRCEINADGNLVQSCDDTIAKLKSDCCCLMLRLLEADLPKGSTSKICQFKDAEVRHNTSLSDARDESTVAAKGSDHEAVDGMEEDAVVRDMQQIHISDRITRVSSSGASQMGAENGSSDNSTADPVDVETQGEGSDGERFDENKSDQEGSEDGAFDDDVEPSSTKFMLSVLQSAMRSMDVFQHSKPMSTAVEDASSSDTYFAGSSDALTKGYKCCTTLLTWLIFRIEELLLSYTSTPAADLPALERKLSKLLHATVCLITGAAYKNRGHGVSTAYQQSLVLLFTTHNVFKSVFSKLIDVVVAAEKSRGSLSFSSSPGGAHMYNWVLLTLNLIGYISKPFLACDSNMPPVSHLYSTASEAADVLRCSVPSTPVLESPHLVLVHLINEAAWVNAMVSCDPQNALLSIPDTLGGGILAVTYQLRRELGSRVVEIALARYVQASALGDGEDGFTMMARRQEIRTCLQTILEVSLLVLN
jgi:hypothetical protein